MAFKVLSIALALFAGCPVILANDLTPPLNPPADPSGVDWSSLLSQSAIFLGVEHGFRWVTEPGTRHPHSSFFDGYVNSLSNLHRAMPSRLSAACGLRTK